MPGVRTPMPVKPQFLDRSLPSWGVVCWQSPRTRRASAPISPATIVMVACAIVGGAAITGQALGVLHWPRPMAFVPAGLVLASMAAPLFAATRAGLRWLGG
jgi:hypothetical protein